MGRQKAYSEIIARLERTVTTIAPTREGTNARKDVRAIIDELKVAQKDPEGDV
jgi:hypothetical protein